MIKKLLLDLDVRTMNSEEEDIQIIFNPEAAQSLFFKIIVLLAVFFSRFFSSIGFKKSCDHGLAILAPSHQSI